MSDADSTFFPTAALDDSTHPAWTPLFKRLVFGLTSPDAPTVVVNTAPCTPADLLRLSRGTSPPTLITCHPLLWTGEMHSRRPVLHVTGYGTRSVLRLMWAWYYRQPPPDWAQIVHAPAQRFAQAIPEIADYGCLGGQEGTFFFSGGWRKCLWPWCLRIEPLRQYLYDKALQAESHYLNHSIEYDIYVSRGLEP